MRHVGRLSAVLTVMFSLISISAVGTAQMSSAATTTGVVASYDGATLNLSQSWGTATVCVVATSGTNCFTTPGDYQTWRSTQLRASPAAGALPLAGCSASLSLYQNLNYGGLSLIVTTPLVWINLSSYGLGNAVSSYQVGGCSVSMTDGANGSGNVYPGATSAGSNVSWIGTAWNDRINSVYIW